MKTAQQLSPMRDCETEFGETMADYMTAAAALAPHAAFRTEVRRFIEDVPQAVRDRWTRGWAGHNRDFTRALAARGWIGMTWPRRYGGQEASELARYVMLEELLVAGAPVSAHWLADRQVGPLLLQIGTETQRQRYLPAIARGDLTFAAGLSEPDSGSDLASIRTQAVKVDGGWRLTGRKIWTSNGTHAEMMLALVRTEPGSKRHEGLSQFIIPLNASGIDIRPIANLASADDFAEVAFDEVFVADEQLVGTAGEGWRQVTMELGLERAGPERFLAGFRLFEEIVRYARCARSPMAHALTGRIAAHLATLRIMAVTIAIRIGAGQPVNLEAAAVKDLGAVLDQELVELARRIVADAGARPSPVFAGLLEAKTLGNPMVSIQGGTRQILRGIIARGLELR